MEDPTSVRKYGRYGLFRANHRLRERGAYVLMQRVYLGVRPDGDGYEELWDEGQWNLGSKNPLDLVSGATNARKQAAARSSRFSSRARGSMK